MIGALWMAAHWLYSWLTLGILWSIAHGVTMAVGIMVLIGFISEAIGKCLQRRRR
jgi:uncharacterized membrane protein